MTMHGPIDQALLEYCASLQYPVQHLTRGTAAADNADGSEYFGELQLAITPDAYKTYVHVARWADPQGTLKPKLDDLRTAEMDRLAQVVRQCLGSGAWPVTVQVALHTGGGACRCFGLGFSGITARSADPKDRKLIMDLFQSQETAPHHLLGLDRVRDALRLVNDVVQGYYGRQGMDACEQPTQLMCWSFFDPRKHADFLWGGIYACSPQEALVKWSIASIGLEATRQAIKDGSLGQEIDPHLELVAQPLDLAKDPRGGAVTWADSARSLAPAA